MWLICQIWMMSIEKKIRAANSGFYCLSKHEGI